MAFLNEKKNEKRCFFPDVALKQSFETSVHQMEEMCETLVLRVVHIPETIMHESDDVKHVYTDASATVEHTYSTVKKLASRDLLKLDDLKFLNVPSMVMNPHVLLLESYTWTSLCILGYMVGTVIGAWAPLVATLSPIFHPINALVMCFILPFFVHVRLRKAHWPEDEQRSAAFYSASLLGAVATFAVGMPSTKFAEFLSLFPMWIGTVSGLHEFYQTDRPTYLGFAIGVPYLSYLVYAAVAIKNWLPFAFAWTIMCAAVAIDLQLKLGRLQRRWAGKEIEQWGTVVAFIVTHFVLRCFVSIFG